MGKVNIGISIDLTNSEGETEAHQVEVEALLPESGPRLIDNVEKAILELNKKTIRQAVMAYFEELSKKSPRKARKLWWHYPSKFYPVSSRWLPHVRNISDWYHLKKRCRLCIHILRTYQDTGTVDQWSLNVCSSIKRARL